MLPAPGSAKGSDAVSATVSSTPSTHQVEGGIVAPAAPGPATATSSAATAPLAVVTPEDKEQQQPTLQHHIDRVKGLRQTMLDACKDMLLAVQAAHTVFGWKYAGPKVAATFVPRAEFETLNFPALLLVDVTTEVRAHCELSSNTRADTCTHTLTSNIGLRGFSPLWCACRRKSMQHSQLRMHTARTTMP